MSLNTRSLILCLFAATSCLHGQAIRDTQDELIAWVDTQKAIAETKTEWSAEKEIVTDLISLLEREKERIEAGIEKLEDSSSATDSRRAELNADRERLLASTDALQAMLPELEASTRTLIARLPAPLSEELDPLTRRLPPEDGETRLPVSQRLLTVVGILNKIDKFNTGITVTSEIRSIGDTSVEVKTLYFGLAGAYFASESSGYAGVGRPGPDGWVWAEEASYADDIIDLIKTYEGAREATFVTLPVEAL